ncbi:penicillin-binding protein 2 [Macrococcus capreoli]|uniref:peptidoglycan D,D-transpeptidase FtsI family protein n=1 Tax=Macrococcus capreoli TaxID=2982690 RepID=UPI0021D5ECD5|nr:penicillin-binding protein 2 [Macrococcus sp. TMW 2.2395]MCU7556851.1 penicillin-binding protein 2 [Macrococcus sp. TMW 2.2395]
MKRVKQESNELKQKRQTNRRIGVIFMAIVSLLIILVLRLGYLQIVKGESYKKAVDNNENIEVNESVPRGRIYDRNGKLLVDNTSKKAITYTRDRMTSRSEMLATAKKLHKLMSMPTDALTLRDKQDYFIMTHKDEVDKLMKKELQLFEAGEISQDKYNEAVYDKLTEKKLEELSKDELEIAAIFREMSSGSQLSPQIIRNKDVSEKEYALVSQNLNDLPGVNTTMDWDRKYVYGKTLRTMLGNVSSKEEGLPKELVDYYLAKGYSRNDRVGQSYLEFQYENVLRGKKKKMRYLTDKSGKIIDSEMISEGSRGNDLILTIDIDLQQKVEKLVDKHIQILRSMNARTMDKVLVVIQDPHNGDILALAGRQIDSNGKISDYHYGTFTSQYAVGSSVKGATLLTGYSNNAIKVGEHMIDQPLVFKGGVEKRSYFNASGKVDIDDKEALMHSSNVYMFKTALKMAGLNYTPNMALPADITEPGLKLRKGLNQFGLGVKTGIDLPNEVTGQTGVLKNNPGNFLDLAIGQYDTYTPLQLSQYISTIANNGYRIQPHLVKEIRAASKTDKIGPVKESIKGKVLNRINNSQDEIDEVKKGFEMAFNNVPGTGYESFKNTVVKSAGKTGTAEVFQDGKPRVNSTYIGYAPIDNPQLSFAIIYTNQPVPPPWLPGGDLGRDIINDYFSSQTGKGNSKTDLKANETNKTKTTNADQVE